MIKEMKEPFIQVPKSVIYNKDLHPTVKLIYMVIKDSLWEGKDFYPSQEYLAKKLGLHKRTVIAGMQELEKNGLIYTKQRGYGRTKYIEICDGEVRSKPDKSNNQSNKHSEKNSQGYVKKSVCQEVKKSSQLGVQNFHTNNTYSKRLITQEKKILFPNGNNTRLSACKIHGYTLRPLEEVRRSPLHRTKVSPQKFESEKQQVFFESVNEHPVSNPSGYLAGNKLEGKLLEKYNLWKDTPVSKRKSSQMYITWLHYWDKYLNVYCKPWSMHNPKQSSMVKRFYTTHGPEKTDGIIKFFIENFASIKSTLRILDEFPTIFALMYFAGQIVPMFERGYVNQYRGEYDATKRSTKSISEKIDDLM